MKKILSIALALTLIVSMMSVSVFAGTEGHPTDPNAVKADTQYWVVGEQGKDNNIDNGLTSDQFTGGEAGADVKINFNQTGTNPEIPGDGGQDVGNGDAIQDRYAIDIVYQNLVVDLTDIPNQYVTDIDSDGTDDIVTITYVWNVNEHIYVKQTSSVPVDSGNQSTANTLPTDPNTPITMDAFYVINHSSLPIQYHAKFASTEAVASMTMKLTYDGGALTATTTALDVTPDFVIDRSRPNSDGTSGSAKEGEQHQIVVSPSTTWLDTLNAVSGKSLESGSKIGSLTITFGKVTTP